MHISIGPDQDINQVREDVFQKASFLCEKKPRKKALIERILGSITQSRKKYWVVAKLSRPAGDRPKVPKRFSLDAEWVDFIESQAEVQACHRVDIVEMALALYRDKLREDFVDGAE